MSVNTNKLFQGDRVIWVVFFFLCMISLVEVYSAASTLSYKSGDFTAPLFKQAIFLGVGTVIVVLVHNIPCRFFKIIPVLGWPLVIILLLLTLAMGVKENGGARWLPLFGFQFQPSELAKGVLITTVALILGAMQREEGADRKAIKYILLATIPICGLIVTENLSTTAILFGVVCMMMFIGRVPFIQLAKLFGVLIVGLALFISLATTVFKDAPSDSILHRFDTWANRIERFVGVGEEGVEGKKDKDENTFDLKENAQVGHAYIAIASSNVIGRMPGNSVERDFLSQAFSDFIYAIIIEEMGLFGGGFVAFLYIVLLFRTGRIASRCERNFPAFLAMGLALLLVCQASINMMVAVGLFPVTGQPLPLISRGGTSTLITCAYVGMILSVSRYARKNTEEKEISTLFASGAKNKTMDIQAAEETAPEAFTDDKGLL